MKRDLANTVLGLFLILGGILFLMLNFGVLQNVGTLLLALFFAGGGAVFLLVFVSNRDHWWALFPAFALLGIAGVIGLSVVAPNLNGPLSGTLFLGMLALSFWIVYLTHPENWWAVIPGGVLLTLAGVAGLADTMAGEAAGALFFLGLGLTFGLVYILPTPQGQMRWAAWPATACLVLGAIVFFTATDLGNVLGPLALILVGGFLVYHNLLRRHAPTKDIDTTINDKG